MHLNVTRSQSGEGKKGNLWLGLVITGARGHLMGCSHPVCGDIPAAGKHDVLTFTTQ